MKSIFVSFLFLIAVNSCLASQSKLIIDADTANDLDDAYAIIRMLKQEQFKIVGLNSAQWFHRHSGDQTVYQSQSLNQEILRLMDREDIPASTGSNDVFGNCWGSGTEAMDSPAARKIIEEARILPKGEKLNVICLGAFTNLASAIQLAPDIVPRVVAYFIGYRYDFDDKIWDKAEFNVLRDYSAANYLLNQEGLETHIMTATISEAMCFSKLDSYEKQAKMGNLGAFLTHQWHSNDESRKNPSWVMWDLALVTAIIHPEWASQIQVMTPPENLQREVWIYDSIDAKRMMTDFWEIAATIK